MSVPEFTLPEFQTCLVSIYNILSQTTFVAVASNGVALPTATIDVTHTQGFAPSGVIYVWNGAGALQTINYTGITATSFTGCTGGTGTLSEFLPEQKPIGTVQGGYTIPAHTRFVYELGAANYFIDFTDPTELHEAVYNFEAQLGIYHSHNPNLAERIEILRYTLGLGPC